MNAKDKAELMISVEKRAIANALIWLKKKDAVSKLLQNGKKKNS